MSYRGLKSAVGLVLALCCGAACSASTPSLIVVRNPIASIPWGDVTSLAFSPDGKYLAVTGSTPEKPEDDATDKPAAKRGAAVACWRVSDWKRVATPRMDAFYSDAYGGQLAWTPDSTKLVICDQRFDQGKLGIFATYRISVWSRDGWRLLSTKEAIKEYPYLAISHDGNSYVSSTRSATHIGVRDLLTGSLKYSVNLNVDPAEKTRRPEAAQDSAAYSSDGKLLAASYGDLVCLINVATRAVISWRRMPDVGITMQFQPNTHNLLVTYTGGLYQMLAGPDLRPISLPMTSSLGNVFEMQFSADGKWFVLETCAIRDNPSGQGPAVPVMLISMVQTASMKVFGIIGPVKDNGATLALSPDGSTVVWDVNGDAVHGVMNGNDHLIVFRTSKPGGPSPDAWLKAHPAAARPAVGKRTLPHKTPARP